MDLPLRLLDSAGRTLALLGLLVGLGSLLVRARGGASPIMVPAGPVLLLHSVRSLREQTAVSHGLSN